MIPAYAWYERQDRERNEQIDSMIVTIDELLEEVGPKDMLDMGDRLRTCRNQLLLLKTK